MKYFISGLVCLASLLLLLACEIKDINDRASSHELADHSPSNMPSPEPDQILKDDESMDNEDENEFLVSDWVSDSIIYGYTFLAVEYPSDWFVEKFEANATKFTESPDASIVISTNDLEPPLIEIIITNSSRPLSSKEVIENITTKSGLSGTVYANHLFLPSGHDGKTIVFLTKTEFVCVNITLTHDDYQEFQKEIDSIIASISIYNKP